MKDESNVAYSFGNTVASQWEFGRPLVSNGMDVASNGLYGIKIQTLG
jgi:hypothetical protein